MRRSASLLSQASSASNSTIEDNLTSSVEDIAQNIFDEASESYNSNNSNPSFRNILRENEHLMTEEERIIRDMDRDLPSNSNSRRRVLNLSLQPNVMSHSSSSSPLSEGENTELSSGASAVRKPQNEVDKISIKLKFLNDEIKIDNQAYLSETLLSFKR